MFTELLVRHCSPVLAGLKTANMFACPFSDREEMRACVSRLNHRLREKGLRILPLRFCENRALIYVYRPARLARDLRQDGAARLLTEYGYLAEAPARCLVHLMQRLSQGGEFPHEIGLFLGYPPEDVCGFIHDASACKFAGLWKVYGDETAARRTMDRFHKCTRLYCDRFGQGCPLERLAMRERARVS